MDLNRAVGAAYRFASVRIEPVHAFVHDVVAVHADDRRYALKLYRPGLRTRAEVVEEAELAAHLARHGAPVRAPVAGTDGVVVREFELGGVARTAVLTPWAPGAKPPPSVAVYEALGEAAAMLHAAADGFSAGRPGEARAEATIGSLVDEPLELMAVTLGRAGVSAAVARLADRVRGRLADPSLERGIVHHDLSLDNVHLDGDRIVVFDLDSARVGWRALEPSGVFAYSDAEGQPFWRAWLTGYRRVRPLAEVDEAAVPLFHLVASFENTAWKLGLTPTSVGPLMNPDQIGRVVEGWLAWADRFGV